MVVAVEGNIKKTWWCWRRKTVDMWWGKKLRVGLVWGRCGVDVGSMYGRCGRGWKLKIKSKI